MKIAKIQIDGLTPVSFSKRYDLDVPMLKGESHDEYENRTWREKGHYDDKGNLVVPPMNWKRCLDAAAKFKGEKIKGRGSATWSKRFVAGTFVMDPAPIPGSTKQNVRGERVLCSANGKRAGEGGSGQVPRIFPIVDKWSCLVTVYVTDDSITRELLDDYMKTAGQFVGMGRFAPRVGGWLGRFTAKVVEWVDQAA